MHDAREFVRWALTHAKRESIPEGCVLALPRERCGKEPWQYLFGSVRVRTSESTLSNYFENHYKNQMTRQEFDRLTQDWDRSGFATDCQGLLDAYLTYEKGESTDVNADMNYRLFCGKKGRIDGNADPFRIGEAVFRANSAGRMKHVGWICGFLGGEPLVVEARGIAYGVVVTKLSERDFTHRGLMDRKFSYDEQDGQEDVEMVKFEYVTPMKSGEAFLFMQRALNRAGCTDGRGEALEEDGKWGMSMMLFPWRLGSRAT